jgi:hypothetical protein
LDIEGDRLYEIVIEAVRPGSPCVVEFVTVP